MLALDRAVKIFGTVGALAEALNVAPSAPSMWRSRKNVPAEHCLAIHKVTKGAVTCQELRPDLDWSVLLMPDSEPAKAA